MSRKVSNLIFAFIISSTVSSIGLQAESILLYPKDMSATSKSFTDIIMDIDTSILISITLENMAIGEKSIYTEVDPELMIGNIIHLKMNLEKGENNIKIMIDYTDNLKEIANLRIFRYTGKAFLYEIPKKYVRVDFHNEKVINRCGDCHIVSSQPVDTFPVPLSKSSCYSCHKRIASGEFVHGPIGFFLCLTCHRPEDNGFQLVTENDSLCFICHYQEKEKFNRRFIHGPVNTGNCLICHDAHSSDNEFLLVKEINEICGKCHPEGHYVNHPVNRHPVNGHPDPLRPGKEFSCTSCHDPHSSNESQYLFYRKTSMYSLCQECHQK
jgi:predicted CXXCH cytochrome family protein